MDMHLLIKFYVLTFIIINLITPFYKPLSLYTYIYIEVPIYNGHFMVNIFEIFNFLTRLKLR